MTVHRAFNATSIWLAFDQALEENKTCWIKNQYPEHWSSKKVNQTLEKIISCGKDQLRTTPKEHQKSKTISCDRPTIFLQYRGNLTQNFASKLKKLYELQVVFTTRKLRSCLPPWNHLSIETRNSTWYIRLNVMDADPSMLGKQAGMLAQG